MSDHPAQPRRSERDRIELLLVTEGAGPDVAYRVKRLLKHALRSFGLRCIGVREIPTQGAQNPRTGPSRDLGDSTGNAPAPPGQPEGGVLQNSKAGHADARDSQQNSETAGGAAGKGGVPDHQTEARR
jgi:hypothetical protein